MSNPVTAEAPIYRRASGLVGEVHQEIIRQAVQDSYKKNCDGYMEMDINDNINDAIKKSQDMSCVNRVTTREYSIVPVGSLEFVSKFLGEMPPIEVPQTLRRFLKRKYQIMKGSDLSSTDSDQYFFKDASQLKSWNSALCFGDISGYIIPDRKYVFSEKVEFGSEYRVFVYKDQILAVQRYLGDPTLFPKEEPLHWMINAYKEEMHPEAYTLDIGVRRSIKGPITEPIEVHPFVSCGLYGFDGYEIPDMLAAGARWYKKS